MPVLKKHNVPYRDFVSRMMKRFSSTNTGTKREECGDSPGNVSGACSVPLETAQTAGPASRNRQKSNTQADRSQQRSQNMSNMSQKRARSPPRSPVFHPMNSKRAQDTGGSHSESNELLPRAKRVRTPGSQETTEDEGEETNERRRARQSVLAYYKMRGLKQTKDMDYTPEEDASEEEAVYSSEEYD